MNWEAEAARYWERINMHPREDEGPDKAEGEDVDTDEE